MEPSSAISIDNGTALMLITVVVLPIAAIAFASSGPAWRSIGKGRFAIEREEPEGELPHPRHSELHRLLYLPGREVDAVAELDGRAAQEAEVRQMVEAKSYRRQRRGEPPLDVEAETERELSNLVGSA